MIKTIIRVKGQEYPYFIEGEITSNGQFIEFDTVSKQGKKRHVELLASEIVSKETSEDEE